MLYCRGIGRKLSVPVLIFSMLGWIVFVIGFAAFNNRENYYNDFRANTSMAFPTERMYFLSADGTLPAQRAGLLWFPHWCVLIVGAFTYLTSILHLCVGRSFTGIFTKFLTAVFMSTGGAVAYTTGVFLFSDTRSGLEYTLLPSLDSWLVNEYYGLWHILEFAGVTGAIFFMALFMMMWPFFSEPYAEYEEYEEEDEEKQEEAV